MVLNKRENPLLVLVAVSLCIIARKTPRIITTFWLIPLFYFSLLILVEKLK